jgi:hypothetical protein
LICSNASDASILKWRQNPGHNGIRPRDIIIRHDDNGGFDHWNGLANLNTFIRNSNMERPNIGCFQGFCEPDEFVILVYRGD